MLNGAPHTSPEGLELFAQELESVAKSGMKVRVNYLLYLLHQSARNIRYLNDKVHESRRTDTDQPSDNSPEGS